MFDIAVPFLDNNPYLRLAIAVALILFIIFMLCLLGYMLYQAYHYHIWGEYKSLSAILRPFNHRADHSHLVNLTTSRV